MENGIVKITSVLDGGTAQRAGIKTDDFITKIDDEPVIEMLLSEAINKIRGKQGTSVKLQIARQNEKTFVVDLKRDAIRYLPETKEEKESNLWLFSIILSVVGIYAVIKIYKAYIQKWQFWTIRCWINRKLKKKFQKPCKVGNKYIPKM